MKKLAALLAVIALAGFAYAADTKVSDISQSDLQAAIASKSLVLLDANGTASYQAGHIPGAIDYTAHKADLAKLLPADKGTLVVAYCANVNCAAYKLAAGAALDLGYTNVKHFAPGIQGWKESGAPVEKE
jgi:rhodanese-related sulfurtransferase